MNAAPIVYALDFPNLDHARESARLVRDSVGMVKVGLELFVAHGPKAVALGQDVGLPVFLDLKLHDIPETVDRAVASACALGARVVTIHGSGGRAMLERAVKRAEREATGLSVVAITVLTSLDNGDLGSLGFGMDTTSLAVRLARLAFDAGVRGFVCSPEEVASLRQALGSDAVFYTPGVRPLDPESSRPADDQKRVATPAMAIRQGAHWVVVGRPIRDAHDPAAMARRIADEVRGASPS